MRTGSDTHRTLQKSMRAWRALKAHREQPLQSQHPSPGSHNNYPIKCCCVWMISVTTEILQSLSAPAWTNWEDFCGKALQAQPHSKQHHLFWVFQEFHSQMWPGGPIQGMGNSVFPARMQSWILCTSNSSKCCSLLGRCMDLVWDGWFAGNGRNRGQRAFPHLLSLYFVCLPEVKCPVGELLCHVLWKPWQ